jgi:cell division protein FtsL
MKEEIIIKTEVVKVDDLQGREKQIYDYAYNKGLNEVKETRAERVFRILASIAILILAIICFYELFLV